jgi:Cytidylate kinase-like family
MAVGSYEKCKRYIESHSPRIEKPTKRKKVYPCVTVSRETGAGARIVCKELIKILDNYSDISKSRWTFFDRKLIEKVLEDHHLPKQISEYMVEDKYRHLSSAIEVLLGLHPSQWTLLHKTTETILQLARMGKVVIVGRGGNIITSKLRNVFHVRLIAPLEDRVKYIMDVHSLNRNDAEAYIKKEDAARRKYLKSNFSKDVENPELYHLIVNTGLLSYKETAEIIADAVMKKFAKFFDSTAN